MVKIVIEKATGLGKGRVLVRRECGREKGQNWREICNKWQWSDV